MSGVSAAAEPDSAGVAEAVQAIDAIVGDLRTDAIDVSTADVTLDAGGASVELSAEAEDGINVESPNGSDFVVGLPFASAADDGTVIDGTVVYDNNNGSTTTPVVHEDGSVQVLTTIIDESAPASYEYDLGLAPGSALVPAADGGVEVVDAGGAIVATVAAPWAFDANGVEVPTWFEVDGTDLVQHIAHVGFAYPVVADPWWGFNITWSNAQVNSMMALLGTGAGLATIAAAICTGTVFGAIPCASAYVVAAAMYGIGIAGLTYCNRNGRGTVIRWLWVGGFNGCSAR